MCGRYTLSAGVPELVEAFDVPVPDFEWEPRFNIAPSQEAPIVAEDRDAWLDRETDGPAASALLRKGWAPDYLCRPVSTRVNGPQEDDPGLIVAVDR